jgi:hypothetical protein
MAAREFRFLDDEARLGQKRLVATLVEIEAQGFGEIRFALLEHPLDCDKLGTAPRERSGAARFEGRSQTAQRVISHARTLAQQATHCCAAATSAHRGNTHAA